MAGPGESITPSSGLTHEAFQAYVDYVLKAPEQPEPPRGDYIELDAATGGNFGPNFRRFTNYDEGNDGYSRTIPLVSIN